MSLKDKIYISEFDLKRLKELVKVAEEFGDRRTVQYLEELDEELDRADLVKSQEIPNDVITMNSTFRLRDLDKGEEVWFIRWCFLAILRRARFQSWPRLERRRSDIESETRLSGKCRPA